MMGLCVFVNVIMCDSGSIPWSEIREGLQPDWAVPEREEGEKQPRVYGLEIVSHPSPLCLCLCEEGGLTCTATRESL